jgi:hypothetical protein
MVPSGQVTFTPHGIGGSWQQSASEHTGLVQNVLGGLVGVPGGHVEM